MLIARLIFECKTPLHCGSGKDDVFLDQPVRRDSFGLWSIQGSSIAGILRSEALKHYPQLVSELFGDLQDAVPSLIWCSDAVLLDFDEKPAWQKKLRGEEIKKCFAGPYIRDHVRINSMGTAIAGGKFDEEIVPIGVRFACEITLDPWNKKLNPEYEKAFLHLVALLCNGEIALGGKISSGYGTISKIYAECRKFDIFSEKGLELWLNLSHSPRFASGEGENCPFPNAFETVSSAAAGLSGTLTLTLKTDSPLLVGGPGFDEEGNASEADMNCLTVPCIDYKQNTVKNSLVLPGASLKGVLHHRTEHILVLLDKKDKKEMLSELFGEEANQEDGTPGKIIVYDSLFSGDASVVQHVAVDRFSGGALPGALFNENPVWQKNLTINITLKFCEVPARAAVFFFHALLDLCEGEITVGSGGMRGNGRLYLDGYSQKGFAALFDMKQSLFFNGKSFSLKNLSEMDKFAAEEQSA